MPLRKAINERGQATSVNTHFLFRRKAEKVRTLKLLRYVTRDPLGSWKVINSHLQKPYPSSGHRHHSHPGPKLGPACLLPDAGGHHLCSSFSWSSAQLSSAQTIISHSEPKCNPTEGESHRCAEAVALPHVASCGVAWSTRVSPASLFSAALSSATTPLGVGFTLL